MTSRVLARTVAGMRTIDITEVHAPPEPAASGAPPSWARRAAVLTLLTTVPSGLWRLAMVVGVPLGVDPGYRRAYYGFPGWGTARVVILTLLLAGLASLTLGLVQPWGEVVPRWVPLLGGRRVPRRAAIVAASVGAVLVTLLWTVQFLNIEGIFAEFGLTGAERIPVVLCYAPLLLWGPLLGAVTVSYARRTRPRG